MAESKEELKSPLMRAKGKSEKADLKVNIQLEPIIQSEVSQKEKYQYSILTHIYGI